MPYTSNIRGSANKRSSSRRLATLRKPKVLLPFLAVVVLLLGLTTWLITTSSGQSSQSSKDDDTASSQPEKISGDKSQAPTAVPDNQSDEQSAATPPASDKAAPPTSPTAPLKEPYGNFVSAHQLPPGATGQTQESTCNTTPGASCTITFTKGSEVKSLPAKTADANGVAYWTWTPDSLGLTTGNWSITAKVTLGSQNKQSSDAKPLEIP